MHLFIAIYHTIQLRSAVDAESAEERVNLELVRPFARRCRQRGEPYDAPTPLMLRRRVLPLKAMMFDRRQLRDGRLRDTARREPIPYPRLAGAPADALAASSPHALITFEVGELPDRLAMVAQLERCARHSRDVAGLWRALAAVLRHIRPSMRLMTNPRISSPNAHVSGDGGVGGDEGILGGWQSAAAAR